MSAIQRTAANSAFPLHNKDTKRTNDKPLISRATKDKVDYCFAKFLKYFIPVISTIFIIPMIGFGVGVGRFYNEIGSVIKALDKVKECRNKLDELDEQIGGLKTGLNKLLEEYNKSKNPELQQDITRLKDQIRLIELKKVRPQRIIDDLNRLVLDQLPRDDGLKGSEKIKFIVSAISTRDIFNEYIVYKEKGLVISKERFFLKRLKGYVLRAQLSWASELFLTFSKSAREVKAEPTAVPVVKPTNSPVPGTKPEKV